MGGKVVYAADEFTKLAPPPLPVSPDWSPVIKYGSYTRPASDSTWQRMTHSYPHHDHAHGLLAKGHEVIEAASGLWMPVCDCFAF